MTFPVFVFFFFSHSCNIIVGLKFSVPKISKTSGKASHAAANWQVKVWIKAFKTAECTRFPKVATFQGNILNLTQGFFFVVANRHLQIIP